MENNRIANSAGQTGGQQSHPVVSVYSIASWWNIVEQTMEAFVVKRAFACGRSVSFLPVLEFSPSESSVLDTRCRWNPSHTHKNGRLIFLHLRCFVRPLILANRKHSKQIMEDGVSFQPGTGAAPATLVELTVGCRYIQVWQILTQMIYPISTN